MKSMSNTIFLATKMVIYAVLIIALSACDMPHNGTRQLAIDIIIDFVY